MTQDKSMPPGRGKTREHVPPGVEFLAFGANVRSIVAVQPPPPTGMVAMDIKGKWNHGSEDTLRVLTSREVAREWGTYLLEAADAAEQDERKVLSGEAL